NLYAREKNDQRVFVLSSMAANAFKEKKPDDFRDKSLLGLADTEKVQRLTLDGPKGGGEGEKRGSDGSLPRPVSAPAETGELNTLVSDAKDTQAASFIP